MGLFKKAKKGRAQSALERDILTAADWAAGNLNTSGYRADYSLDSMREVDRFFDEQSSPEGAISTNRGPILFALGSYVGQTAIRLYGGRWIADDNDPQGEINAAVELANGTLIWPIMRCMKRYQNGAEDGVYAYMLSLGAK